MNYSKVAKMCYEAYRHETKQQLPEWDALDINGPEVSIATDFAWYANEHHELKTAEQIHEGWVKLRTTDKVRVVNTKQGNFEKPRKTNNWIHGPEFDHSKRTNPFMCPFGNLTQEQKLQMTVYARVVVSAR